MELKIGKIYSLIRERNNFIHIKPIKIEKNFVMFSMHKIHKLFIETTTLQFRQAKQLWVDDWEVMGAEKTFYYDGVIIICTVDKRSVSELINDIVSDLS